MSGHLTLVGTLGMSTVLCIIMHLYLRRENSRREAAHKPVSEYTYTEMVQETDEGDNATFFRYTI